MRGLSLYDSKSMSFQGDTQVGNKMDFGSFIKRMSQQGVFPDPQVRKITNEYPALAGQDWQIVDSRQTAPNTKRQLEFYPPTERYNPHPFRPTVEIFNPNLRGEYLDRAIMGDMLHYMPEVDPKFDSLREAFRQTLEPWQLDIDRDAYQRRDKNDQRSFEKWFEQSRLDAYLRGYLAPDKDNNWADAYTPRQKEILEMIKGHLKSAQ
jgi:hypothetical protein